jgi:catechol 2,3-dioxygenase-like lactoylglutathione lyase family enzyme
MIRQLSPCVPLLQVFDLSLSLKFYCDVLGFHIVQRTDNEWWAMLRLGDAILMLNTAYENDQKPPSPDPARVRGHTDVSLYFEYLDLDALHSHLRAHRCQVAPPGHTSYGLRQMNVTDPDGYEICFTAPRALHEQ